MKDNELIKGLEQLQVKVAELKNAKLFKIVESDGNDRDTYAHVKANSLTDVIEWLKKTYFKPEALDLLTIDKQSDTEAFIMWTDCGDCENKNIDECEYCEIPSSYLEITEIQNPNSEDFEFKTIYGTNEYYDLTLSHEEAKTE